MDRLRCEECDTNEPFLRDDNNWIRTEEGDPAGDDDQDTHYFCGWACVAIHAVNGLVDQVESVR